MNIIDLLLQADVKAITEKPTKKIEIKRLSEKLGQPFEVTCQAINATLYSNIQKRAINFNKGGIKDIDIAALQKNTVLEGLQEPNLKNQELVKKYSVATPLELVDVLFLPGEIAEISAAINELCGYDKEQDEVDEEVKN